MESDNKDDDLMEVFKEMANIPTDNNKIIPELLEEEILEKVLIEGQ